MKAATSCSMNIDIITIQPELLKVLFEHSIMKRAQEKNLLSVAVHHLRKWAVNEYGQVDDYQYGGAPEWWCANRFPKPSKNSLHWENMMKSFI